ncbi:MAG: multidrug effflux MFS transporter [Verrucomicrobiales bacterium]|nr:multidrug effflux MFS transporter [Verrucomicrobiales bacterium]MCP5524124.1 multidrug effflux MFS transporter [Verrucomicrobiales bacterium]
MHPASSTKRSSAASASALRTLAWLLAALSALGPFSIDTYLPSFRDIGRSFNASPLLVQQTLTAYMLPFAAMTLWQGALSDTYGRRRVTLVMLAAFALASLGCFCAWSIGILIGFRVLQGVSAGAGMIIGRAIVRDLFDGVEARRLMSRIVVVFAIAPAVAPIIGGWLQVWFGWRSVFAFLTLFATTLWFACWKALPETLAPDQRHPLRPRPLLQGYWKVLSSGRFLALAFALALSFSAVFVYIVSAPAFLFNILHRSETEFVLLLGPISAGMMAGTWLAGRIAGQWSNPKTLAVAYSIMALTAAGNVVLHWSRPALLPWCLMPLAGYVLGSALAMPSLTLMALDLFPHRRGMASSCQGFVQTVANALIAALVAPAVWDTAHRLSGAALVLFAMSAATLLIYFGLQRLNARSLASVNSNAQSGAATG